MQDEQTSVNALNEPVLEQASTQESISSPDDNVSETPKDPATELPEYAKERLGIQKKRHEKEVAALKRQIDALSQVATRQQPQSVPPESQIQPGSVQEQVLQTLAALAAQKQKEEEAERLNQINEEIKRDAAKYDDFDDVVYDESAPFTVPIAQAALELPNTADVLYSLGKDRKELSRITNLRPIDMKRELVKLSVSLMNKKSSNQVPSAPKPLQNLKSNPLTKTTSGIQANSTVAEIRRLLKRR